MTTLQTINASASPEVQMNENVIALSAAGAFGIKLQTTAGLLLALYGGIIYVDGVATAIADLDAGTRLSLTASATNYVERTRAGVASANTSGFTAGRIPLYTVTTNGTGITGYTDYRDLTTPLQKGRVGVTVTTADVTLSAAEARVDEVKATGTLTGNRSIIVPAVAWAWIVDNATAGAFALTVKTAAGSGVVVPQGTKAVVYCDGTDVKAIDSIAGNLTVGGNISATGTLTASGTGTHTIGGLLDLSGASAGQIKFPATQNASANANTFDDYEEGTWTPILTFATPGDLSVTYDEQHGAYTKKGKEVTVHCNIGTSAFTHTTASGTIQITGLPFTVENTSVLTCEGAVVFQGITKAGYTNFTWRATPNTTTTLIGAAGSGQGRANVATGDVPSGGAPQFKCSLTYIATA